MSLARATIYCLCPGSHRGIFKIGPASVYPSTHGVCGGSKSLIPVLNGVAILETIQVDFRANCLLAISNDDMFHTD